MIHAITATWAIDKERKRQALLRHCPKCRREQMAEGNKLNEPVLCEKCGSEIPPKASANRKMKEKQASSE